MIEDNSFSCSTPGKKDEIKHAPSWVIFPLLVSLIFAPFILHAKSCSILISLASPYSQTYFPPELLRLCVNS